MAKKLVIVESPTKTRTIKKFLSGDYEILASGGHVRDLPQKRLGVDIKNNFQPRYENLPGKYKFIRKIREAARAAEQILIATDEDREGEAIGWHLISAAKLPRKKVNRITFHEITPAAIKEALQNPQDINQNLVDAQQARRILDRLVGYKLSPYLWQKIRRGLSAGRVQSVASRLIMERETEIANFKSQQYWTIAAELSPPEDKNQTFPADLVEKNGQKYEKKITYQLFAEKYQVKTTTLQDKREVDEIIGNLQKSKYEVITVAKKEKKKSPPPPFTTSSLQQEAAYKLGFSAKKTMQIAQQLYEGINLGEGETVGLITYMRTDSLSIASSAQKEALKYIEQEYGKKYVPAKPHIHKARTKGAQEAHEAIRPTSTFRIPEKIRDYLEPTQFKLYDLIWVKFVASQMANALAETLSINIKAGEYGLHAGGETIKFDGFIRLSGRITKEITLPSLKKGDKLHLVKLIPEEHSTSPPPRYNTASLIKTLEKHGIGRPSTYAPIITTILSRGYVEMKDKKFYPCPIGESVNILLKKNFADILSINFTAKMEDQLDEIALGKQKWSAVVNEFWQPFSKTLATALVTTKRQPLPVEKTDEVCEKCGHPMVIREGRFGRFLACSNFPKCRNIKSILEKIGVKCPDCDGEIVKRRTKKGRFFYGCSNWPKCKFVSWNKPREKKSESRNPND